MTTPDRARLREELGALTARVKEALCCAGLSGWALGDADRLGTLATELLDRVEELERLNAGLCDRVQAQSELLARRAGKAEAVPQPSLTSGAVPHENPPPPPP